MLLKTLSAIGLVDLEEAQVASFEDLPPHIRIAMWKGLLGFVFCRVIVVFVIGFVSWVIVAEVSNLRLNSQREEGKASRRVVNQEQVEKAVEVSLGQRLDRLNAQIDVIRKELAGLSAHSRQSTERHAEVVRAIWHLDRAFKAKVNQGEKSGTITAFEELTSRPLINLQATDQ